MEGKIEIEKDSDEWKVLNFIAEFHEDNPDENPLYIDAIVSALPDLGDKKIESILENMQQERLVYVTTHLVLGSLNLAPIDAVPRDEDKAERNKSTGGESYQLLPTAHDFWKENKG